jgi:hypothetical protein
VVEKSTSRVANMNSEGLSDCESNLLEGVDRWCWVRVGVSVETPRLCEFPIMVGKFEDAFWAWEVCDLVVHRSGVGFYWCERDRVRGLGLKDWSESSLLLWRLGSYCDQGGCQ